jgi:hypothetical protein
MGTRREKNRGSEKERVDVEGRVDALFLRKHVHKREPLLQKYGHQEGGERGKKEKGGRKERRGGQDNLFLSKQVHRLKQLLQEYGHKVQGGRS